MVVTSPSLANASCGPVNHGAQPGNAMLYCAGEQVQRYDHCGNSAGILTGLQDHWFYCNYPWTNLDLENVRVCENNLVEQTAVWQDVVRTRTVYSRNKGWVWSPNPNTVYVGTPFSQTSNCGNTRTAVGTKPLPDDDADGVLDSADQCADTPVGESVDANGCSYGQLDEDNDGVNNAFDECPDTLAGDDVDVLGCSATQRDSDADGVNDALDQCPGTVANERVDYRGCGQTQIDSDGDGISDALDQCEGSTPGANVNYLGCEPMTTDTDKDGITDDFDVCPSTPSAESANSEGCSISQIDSDNDGISDAADLCADTPDVEMQIINGCSFSQYDHPDEAIAALQLNVQKACPKKWENVFVDLSVEQNLLDIWQGDLSDKALFVQYADQFLLDENGKLLIDSYNDTVTIMTECAASRVHFYKAIRIQIASTVGHLVSALTGQTAFSRTGITDGVDYDDWVEGTNPDPGVLKPVELQNLAMGRATTQSGTSSDELSDTETERTDEEYGDLAEKQGYAALATDNDTDGNFANGSVSHTGFQDQPYWEVSLDQESLISSITIYNRTDCCRERLSNYSILIASRPIDERKLDAAKALSWVTVAVNDDSLASGEDSKTYVLPKRAFGQYVRIQLAGKKTVLSLSEVEVMGLPLDQEL